MTKQVLSSRAMIVLAALVVAGCGEASGDGTPADPAAGPQGAAPAQAGAAVNVPDSCTFIPRAELESAVGWELRDGTKEEAPGGSTCTFKVQRGIDRTRDFPNPAISPALGLTSVVIGTSAADPQAVDEIRQLDPSAFEAVPGLGDDAYYLGPNLLHVRVGQASFSIRVNTGATAEADVAKVREVMVALARSGVAKL